MTDLKAFPSKGEVTLRWNNPNIKIGAIDISYQIVDSDTLIYLPFITDDFKIARNAENVTHTIIELEDEKSYVFIINIISDETNAVNDGTSVQSVIRLIGPNLDGDEYADADPLELDTDGDGFNDDHPNEKELSPLAGVTGSGVPADTLCSKLADCDGDGTNDKEDAFPRDASRAVAGIDSDGDGFLDDIDAFLSDPCASLDTDGDDKPDNLHCPETDPETTTSLEEDMDDDNDGVDDLRDDFPKHACASVDTDGDTYPDSFHDADDETVCTVALLNDYKSTFAKQNGIDVDGMDDNDGDTDDDGDGFNDESDDFALDRCARLDTDGDTKPDELLVPNCDTSLIEDTDDDNDNIPDLTDDFPKERCASKDTDGDFSPDQLHTEEDDTGCTADLLMKTSRVADPDDDNDGIADDLDKFPKNACASKDTDGDKIPDTFNTVGRPITCTP